jgi:hypothetical protein
VGVQEKMKLNQELRQEPLYKLLLSTFDVKDATGPIQEKRGILNLSYEDSNFILNTGDTFAGTAKSPLGLHPSEGDFYLDKRVGSSNKVLFVGNKNKDDIIKAFAIIIASCLQLKAPYRIIEKENWERIIIQGIL